VQTNSEYNKRHVVCISKIFSLFFIHLMRFYLLFLVMDSFIFDFNVDSTLTNDANSSQSNLDWTAFQSAPPPTTNSPFSPLWLSQQDDAVAPNNQSTIITTTPNEDEIYVEIEHFFNGLNQQQQQQQTQSQPIQQQQQQIIEPIHVNINIPDQTMNDRDHVEPPVSEKNCSNLSYYIYIFSLEHIYH
jgi:hypothetical protein